MIFGLVAAPCSPGSLRVSLRQHSSRAATGSTSHLHEAVKSKQIASTISSCIDLHTLTPAGQADSIERLP